MFKFSGQVGTVVYNTTWTTTALGTAARQLFMDTAYTSVVEKAQAFVLDTVALQDSSLVVCGPFVDPLVQLVGLVHTLVDPQ